MTRRSRSSFDLRDALTTAEALSPKPPPVQTPLPVEVGPLVAFGPPDPSSALPPPPSLPSPSMRAAVAAAKPVLPAPPDVDALSGITPRLTALMDWLRGDADITRVLVVDDEGLPLVGSHPTDLGDAESLLAATGSVAGAMKRLALATPGALSPDFEGHVGDGPVLQLIGLSILSASQTRRAFVVGISRRQPLGQKDVDAVRAAFSKALATTIPRPPISSSGRSGDG